MSLLAQPRPVHPRERLSLFTHSTLGHDVSAALKASSPLDITRTNKAVQETLEAPPPSPVDFGRNGFHHAHHHHHQPSSSTRLDDDAGVVRA